MDYVKECVSSLQLDNRKAIIPSLSKDLSKTLMFYRIFMDTKEPDQYGKFLLYMCNSTGGMVIGNGIPISKDIGGHTCRRHSGDNVTDYVLLSKIGMHNVQNPTLGN